MGGILKTAAMIVLVFLPAVSMAQNVTIAGKDFYLDGKPWLPKGINAEGFIRPAFIPSAPKWMNDPANQQGRAWWSDQEIHMVKTVFGANIIRFNISQAALDPQSPIYDLKYRDELVSVFQQVRKAGLAVVVSMDAYPVAGLSGQSCMPDQGTARAWKTLAPVLMQDHGILFEIFNEPCKNNWGAARTEWAAGMQQSLDAIRRLGANNLVLLDGLGFGQWANDLFSLVHDSAPGRLAMSVHPYLDPMKSEANLNPEEYWRKRFGVSAAQYPMIVTEWNATETNGCVDERTPELALELIRYLQRRHIGLIGWAIDSKYGKLVKDHEHFEPTDFQDFHGCLDKTKASGPSGVGKLLARFPND